MKLHKQLIIYFGVTAINAILSFAITSLLTHQIKPEDYGRIYLYSSFLNFLTPFITMGILYPLSVEYFKCSHDSYSFYFTNAQVIPLISLAFFTVLCLVLQHPLSGLLHVPVYWIWVMPVTVWWVMINETSTMITRNNNKPYQFAFFSIGKTVTELLGTLLFVLLLQISWQGRLLSAAAAPMLLGILSLFLFTRWKLIERKIDRQLVKKIFILSFPFIFERLSVFIMNSSGQYFIDNMVTHGTAEVGLYSLGNTIAQILFLVVLSMNYAYQPHLFRKLSEGLKRKFHKTTSWYILACALTVLALFIFIPLIFRYFFAPAYIGAKKYAYMLVVGCFMWGVYNAFQVYLIYIHKKGLILYIALLGMILSLSLNFYMVPHYGAMGAAISSIITYSVMALACFLFVRRFYLLQRA